MERSSVLALPVTKPKRIALRKARRADLPASLGPEKTFRPGESPPNSLPAKGPKPSM